MSSDNLSIHYERIGSLIKVVDERNTSNNPYPAIGINKDKDFMPTVANLDGADLRKYKVVRKGYFVFSGMQTGRDQCIRIGLFDRDEISIISPAYTTFVISAVESIIPEFFFMFFNRLEMDRYGAFCSDGSVRSNLDWDRFMDFLVPIPSIEQQKSVVEVWKSLRKIKVENEALASPLMNLCQSYIQECRYKYQHKELRSFITESDDRNTDNKYTAENVRGVSIQKVFIPTKADMTGVPVSSYKIVNKDMFAFNPNTARMGDKFSIAINQSDETYLVSSIYPVFYVSSNELNPSFLKMWFERVDFDRYARYHSWGSAREMFNFSDMQRVKLPIPPIEVQQAIVSLYHSALEYKSISEMADAESRRICPALLQHVINN